MTENGEDLSQSQSNKAAAFQSAPIQPLPIVRALARLFPAVQNVPLMPEKARVARFITGRGKGELVGLHVAN